MRTIEKIDRVKAIQMLSKNINNRDLDYQLIKKYCILMSYGRWETDFDNPIKLTKSGQLVDGQHRLSAVIMSGKAIEFSVLRTNIIM